MIGPFAKPCTGDIDLFDRLRRYGGEGCIIKEYNRDPKAYCAKRRLDIFPENSKYPDFRNALTAIKAELYSNKWEDYPRVWDVGCYCKWAIDPTRKAAIWACGRQAVQCSISQSASGFVWLKISGVCVYSWYAAPSLTLSEIEGMLNNLIHDPNGRCPKVTAGDFNAWTLESITITRQLLLNFGR